MPTPTDAHRPTAGPATAARTLGRIVGRHPAPHHCQPGWEVAPEADGDTRRMRPLFFPPEGSVWLCPCGTTWVAFYDTRGGFHGAQWRPEKRRERRRRARGTP